MFAKTPKPPYFAVIFTSVRMNEDGYAEMAARMDELSRDQPGYLGIESVRGADGLGITVSYWADEASIRAWKAVGEHRLAQSLGRETWYESYVTRVAKVEREYGWERE